MSLLKQELMRKKMKKKMKRKKLMKGCCFVGLEC